MPSFHLTMAALVMAWALAGVPALGQVAAASRSGTRLLTVKEVRAGMRGVGRTVFSGEKVEEFQVEILGVLENAGPKQNIILARLSGGPIERTGVMQGMSGSPVYIDGRLVGAVAMAFPFSKEPIAGIRPIEEMLRHDTNRRAGTPRVALNDRSLTARLEPPNQVQLQDAKLIDIATPVSFNGFTRATIDHFAPQLRALGFEPQQGISGGKSPNETRSAVPLEPGSMISVQLITGDLNAGADGTVTHIEGNKVYAFGHRFLSIGPTEMPFARSSVVALLPNVNSSFKIAASGEALGTITTDFNSAISGELGRKPRMVPVSIEVRGGGHPSKYQMNMVSDRLLSPLLLQMSMYSALDSTERTLGTGTVSLRGTIEFEKGALPVRIENVYAGDFNVPLQASLSTAIPVAYALQNNLDNLALKSIDLIIEPSPEKKLVQVEQVWASRREVRPGEKVQVIAEFTGQGGQVLTRTIDYTVPVGAQPGSLFFTVADGSTINSTDARIFTVSEAKPAAQIVTLLNAMKPNNKAYVRVWRSDPAYQVQGEDLPDPPPSVAMILARNQAAAQQYNVRGSKVAEMEISVGDVVVNGSKTIRVEVKD